MTWRSPFQASKGGGVPFPALTPWANSPAETPNSGSPMQISPASTVKSVIKRNGQATSSKAFTIGKGSPMDAAPYTPVSTRKANEVPVSASGKHGGFVGKLSFTPLASRHLPSSGFKPNRKSPNFSSIDQSTSSIRRVQPPKVSMYAQSDDANVHTDGFKQCQTALAGVLTQSLPHGRQHQSSRESRNAAQSPLLAALSTRNNAVAKHALQQRPDSEATLATQPPTLSIGPQTSNSRGPQVTPALQQVAPNHNLSLPQPSSQLETLVPSQHIKALSDSQPGTPKPCVPSSQPAAAAQSGQWLFSHRSGSDSIMKHSQHQQSLTRFSGKYSQDIAKHIQHGKRAAGVGSPGLAWQPMQAPVYSPDKLELGRRIFGGLPASVLQGTPKDSAKQARGPSETNSFGTPLRAQPQVQAPLEAMTPSYAAVTSGSISHAQLIQQLQRQLTQAAASAGAAVEQIGAGLQEAEPSHERLHGATQAAEAVSKLEQLQQIGADCVQQLQSSQEESLARHAHSSRSDSQATSKHRSTAAALRPRVHRPAPAIQHTTVLGESAVPENEDGVPCTDQHRDIREMLTRLQLLQQEGSELAVAA